MGRQFNNVVSVIHSFGRFGLLKIMNGKNFDTHMIERFSPNVVFKVPRGAKVKIGKMVRAHSGCKIKMSKNGELVIGDNVRINYYCIFICQEKITVGSGTEFGPSVYLYDHDHDFRAGLKKGKFKSAPITIGKNCWIGANTIILRGTTIGDNCVIGAGSVVRGVIPDNTVFVQRRTDTLIPFEVTE